MISIMEENLKKVYPYFSVGELKAVLNALVMPLFLMVLSKNILIGICWVLLITVIYKTVQKEKVENAKYFFRFLLAETVVICIIGFIVLLLSMF